MTEEDIFARERRTLRNIALNFTDIGADLGEIARKIFTQADQIRLRAELLSISDRLGHLGDSTHLARHALRDMAREEPSTPVDLARLAELVGVSEATAVPRDLSLRITAPLLPGWKRFIKRLLQI